VVPHSTLAGGRISIAAEVQYAARHETLTHRFKLQWTRVMLSGCPAILLTAIIIMLLVFPRLLLMSQDIQNAYHQTDKRNIAAYHRTNTDPSVMQIPTDFPRRQRSLSSGVPRHVALRPEGLGCIAASQPPCPSLCFGKTCFSFMRLLPRAGCSSISTMHTH